MLLQLLLGANPALVTSALVRDFNFAISLSLFYQAAGCRERD
jgi:hypothetical protein